MSRPPSGPGSGSSSGNVVFLPQGAVDSDIDSADGALLFNPGGFDSQAHVRVAPSDALNTPVFAVEAWVRLDDNSRDQPVLSSFDFVEIFNFRGFYVQCDFFFVAQVRQRALSRLLARCHCIALP